MAAGFRDGLDQFLHFLGRRELVVCAVKNPEWNSTELLRPPGDQRDWTQCQHCGKTRRHFVGGVERAPPAHALSSDIVAVGIDPAVLYHVVEHSRERIDISPNFSRRTLRRDHNERELRIGFSDFRRAEALHLVDVIAAKRTAMEIEKEWISIRSGRIAPGQRYQVLH